MRAIAIPSLVVAAIVSGFWTATIDKAQAVNLTDIEGNHANERSLATATEESTDLLSGDRLMAQFFYPSPSDRQGVMVQGQGEASAPADTARVVFQLISGINPFEQPPEVSSPSPPNSLTEERLQPVVNALVAHGVPADAISVTSTPTSSSLFSFPFPFPRTGGGAQLVVNLDQPTRSRVQQVVTTASDATSVSDDFSIQSVNVEYAVNNCEALERQAYTAAVKDAQNRARALAAALGVEIRETPSVAESPLSGFSPFSSSSSCSSKADVSFFPFNAIQPAYDPAAPAEVRVKKDLFVTYPVR